MATSQFIIDIMQFFIHLFQSFFVNSITVGDWTGTLFDIFVVGGVTAFFGFLLVKLVMHFLPT